MQIKRLHTNFYKLYAYARTQECLQAYRDQYQHHVKQWEKLQNEGVDPKTIQAFVGISRATYFRYKNILREIEQNKIPPSKKPIHVNKPKWGEAQKQLVLKLRRENPTYGKEKIAVILKRDHAQTMSESTVGRILTHLKQKRLITKSPSALRTKKKRTFKKHAKPWEYKNYKDMVLGERVQIDHMTVTKNGITLKHFQAWDRQSKYIAASVYSNAKASSAKRFLIDFVKQAPFKVLSIQVDGGSEFMAEFEKQCQQMNIPLIVLPPAKPQYNGGVERANRTFREEFYNKTNLLEDSIRGMQAALTQHIIKYNTFRPHKNLNGLTPLQYIQNQSLEDLPQSHST